MDFLREVNLGKKVKVGKKVLVLGGGNVAFDCARVARRLGAAEVHMACLESKDKMLASREEIEQGQREGIGFHPSRTFTKIVGKRNVAGVERRGGILNLMKAGQIRVRKAPKDAGRHGHFAIGQRPEIPARFWRPPVGGNP
jgi:NADPH-dependent glutamate synthase beta subunit-like oxidoreductase